MSDEINLNKILAEATDRIRREGYAAGWRDAITAITKSTATLAAEPIPEMGSDVGISLSFVNPKRAAELGITPGTTQFYVFQAVANREGMTGAEIVSTVTEGGHKVPEQNIRTALFRLGKRKAIVSRHGRWFVQRGKD